jgi:hypothetical protein
VCERPLVVEAADWEGLCFVGDEGRWGVVDGRRPTELEVLDAEDGGRFGVVVDIFASPLPCLQRSRRGLRTVERAAVIIR